MTELSQLDATAQAELVRTGDVSPIELVDAAITSVEKLNPELNAVIHPLFEAARAAAVGKLPEGPFRGVPILFKDLFCGVEGDPLHEGMQFLKDAGWRHDHTETLAHRYLDAGFVCIGRTNTPELGLVPTTEPAAYGPTRNPWDTTRTPGGSSGGSAAAVAAGMVAVAHANDGGGSIRIPASCCGLVGLKPSRGRTSLGPDYSVLDDMLIVELCVSRSVRDTAGVLDALAGRFGGDTVTAPAPAPAVHPGGRRRARPPAHRTAHRQPARDRRHPSRLRRGRARRRRAARVARPHRGGGIPRRGECRTSCGTSPRSGPAPSRTTCATGNGRSGARSRSATSSRSRGSSRQLGRSTTAVDYIDAQHAALEFGHAVEHGSRPATTSCSRRRSASRP